MIEIERNDKTTTFVNDFLKKVCEAEGMQRDGLTPWYFAALFCQLLLPGTPENHWKLFLSMRKAAEKTVEEVFKVVDFDGSGTIDCPEFLNNVHRANGGFFKEDEYKSIFEIVGGTPALVQKASNKDLTNPEYERLMEKKHLVKFYQTGKGSIQADFRRMFFPSQCQMVGFAASLLALWTVLSMAIHRPKVITTKWLVDENPENSRYSVAWESEFRLASFFILAVAGSFLFVALCSLILLTSDPFLTITLGFRDESAQLLVLLAGFLAWLITTVLAGVYGQSWVPLFDGL